MNYNEARQYLDIHNKKGIVLGLETMQELMRRLGNPQDKMKFIHVAGTNGKGSVVALTSNILGEAGYVTGRYCSPSVFCYEEKIQVYLHGKKSNGESLNKKNLKRENISNKNVESKGQWQYISQNDVAELLTRVRMAADSMEKEGLSYPTVFELETAMAFCYFEKMNCDYVLLETGMGGDLDATNIVTTTCCAVLVSIDIDHSKILGNTLGEIAGHKAGIIKPKCDVVTMEQKPEARMVIEERCKELRCKLVSTTLCEAYVLEATPKSQKIHYKEFPIIETQLLGTFQKDNIAVVLEVIKCLREQGIVISDKTLVEGIYNTKWPGRLEVVCEKPWILLDGAHNPDAAVKLSQSLQKYFTNKKIVYIMGVLGDKDYKKVLSYLCPQGKAFFTITPNNARALPAIQLKRAIEEILLGEVYVPVKAMDSIEQALQEAQEAVEEDGVIVACGSLSFLGDLRTKLQEIIGKC